MGIADAKYKFIYIDVGANGRISDGGVFRNTSFFRALPELNLPAHSSLPGRQKPIPYFLVADDAFALSNNVMKPYSKHNLTGLERIFNYRLSRARRVVENAFGILSNRFRVFGKPIALAPEKVRKITVACCALHNYLIMRSSIYLTPSLVDRYDANGNVVDGEWRQNVVENGFHALEHHRNRSNVGKDIRDELAQYFVNEGELDFQNTHI